MVNYTQEIYRKMLDSASFPGKLNNIDNINIENNTKLLNGAIGIAITLLDQEVTFYIENYTQKDIKNIRALTVSNQIDYRKSDYIFLDINSEVDILQIKLDLSGPGIKSKNSIYINGIREEFIERLSTINKDYPIGIDLILVDKKGEIAFIPRSSKLSWEVL
ncbi:phosphonate C-P lyase system protein PhnH [Clostridioides difficile]|uniref:phosphonate C-P lyase system protein PhnH n=1 Tax=Clostridioides difficile TaxID=1496 RepID=UPI002114CF48|nr:phosphonate C-P lyase system protein PhnH [Clostridioides difficile]MCQ7009817.1 phosphonate C-P lyase system protein PhnH [Clostridioides difficile]